MTTLNVVTIPPEARHQAAEHVANVITPYVRDAARQRLGPIRYAAVSPFLGEVLVEIVIGVIAFAVPALAPFAPVILEIVKLIDVSHLSDDAKTVLETLLGLIKH